MARSKLKRRLILVMASLLLIYFLGYAFCRYERWIVHYTASAGGKCSYHGVDAGDYKMGSLNPALAFIYTPLRYVELIVWRVTKPLGSSC